MGLKIDSDGVVRFNAKRTFVVDCPTTLGAITVGAGDIGTTEIADLAVTTGKINDLAVTTGKIAAGAVTTAKIAALNVTSAELAANAVTTAKITDANVTVGKMAANSVDSDQYVDGSIDLIHMSANSVDSDQYVDGSIDLIHMSANSVDSDQYVDGSIDTAHIAAGNVTLPKVSFIGLKILQADGLNTAGGDAEVTLTGTVIGERVIGIIGSVKVAHAGAWKVPVIGTDFEAVITVTDKVVQKMAAGDLSANTYFFLIVPATS